MEATISHTTKISAVEIKDEAAIVKAVEELRLRGVKVELKRDARVRLWYSEQSREVGNCDYVLHLPDCQFDVGLKKNKHGVFEAITDMHANQVGQHLGGACAIPKTSEEKALWNIGAFAQEYAKQAAINAAWSAGYTVESADVDAKTGEVNLVLTGM